MGFAIFLHSVRMVLRNFQQAVQISLVPALIAMAIIMIVGGSLIGFEELSSWGAETSSATEGEIPEGFAGFFVIVALVFILTTFWIVVNWHRFVLLEEYPQGWVPPFRTDRVLAYLGKGLILVGIGLVVMVPLVFVSALAGSTLGAALLVVGWLAMVSILYRLAVILPAAAVGAPLSIADAWEATMGQMWTIIVLLLTSFVFQLLVQLVFAAFAMIPVIGTLLVLIPSVLILPLINVSVLTTMYGVFVEKRSLD
jgi:hypothetical protein